MMVMCPKSLEMAQPLILNLGPPTSNAVFFLVERMHCQKVYGFYANPEFGDSFYGFLPH